MYKINAAERIEEINTHLVPFLEKKNAEDVVRNYKKILIDPRDIEENYDYSALDKLKSNLQNG